MRRLFASIAVIVVIAAAAAFLLRESIAFRLMQRVVTRNLAHPLLDALPDGLHVALCGAGSPLPDVDRSGPCVAVVAGGKLYVVDAGAGASRVLSRMNLPQGRVEALLLTHFHSDHIDGVGELMLQRWAGGGRDAPLPVYGPEGVERVVDGFNEAYAQDFVYRLAHHGPSVVPPTGAGAAANPFVQPSDGELPVVLEDGDLRITAFRVNHAPVTPAVGYRFDYKGRSAVISGDTAKSENLQAVARGVDLLVHEALSPTLVDVMTRGAAAAGATNIEKITRDIIDYHTTPIEAAEIARDAAVGHLLFYHIVPPLPLAVLRGVFTAGVADVYSGPVTVGRDGTAIHMPAATREITLEQIL